MLLACGEASEGCRAEGSGPRPSRRFAIGAYPSQTKSSATKCHRGNHTAHSPHDYQLRSLVGHFSDAFELVLDGAREQPRYSGCYDKRG
jgi:hypothetical protein